MRRPRAWGQPCPNAKCPLFKLMDRGHVSAISTYMTESGKRRIFRCQRCETTFSETRDTVFFDLRTSEEKVLMALKRLLVRVDLSGIAFVLGVLDEMWNFMARKHARETDEAGASLPEGEDGRQWVGVSFAPEFRWMLAAVVGPRTLDTAKEVVAITKALIAAFHVVTTFARIGRRGRPRQPVCEPHPDLVYAPLVKRKKQGMLLTRSTRVVLGAERLTQRGLTISTALVERVNLTLRQALAPLVRQTSSFCKDRERMRQRVVFFQAFYNVARPHMSLPEAVAEARAPSPRRDSSPMAGAHAGDGGRLDGSRLDLS